MVSCRGNIKSVTVTHSINIRSIRRYVSAETNSRPNHSAYLDKGLALLPPDMLQRHQQQNRAEINFLLQNIQSLITYQKTVSLWKVRPGESLISQMERQRLPMRQQRSAKMTPYSRQCP